MNMALVTQLSDYDIDSTRLIFAHDSAISELKDISHHSLRLRVSFLCFVCYFLSIRVEYVSLSPNIIGLIGNC